MPGTRGVGVVGPGPLVMCDRKFSYCQHRGVSRPESDRPSTSSLCALEQGALPLSGVSGGTRAVHTLSAPVPAGPAMGTLTEALGT